MITPDRTSSSPFYNDWPPSGLGVVIHSTRSGKSMNPNELEGTLSWFQNPKAQVSAHWVIGRNGEKVRVIADDQQAWHAGRELNATHFGIELEQGVDDDGFTPPQLAALVAVCLGYMADFDVPVVHAANGSAPGFIGHEETEQGRGAGKSDPGRFFNWSGFIAEMLRAVLAPTLPQLPAYVTQIVQKFSDGTSWVLDVKPPPGRE